MRAAASAELCPGPAEPAEPGEPAPAARMLSRLGGRRLRPLPVLLLGPRAPPALRAERSAPPARAAASASAAGPGGWYEALAGSAPVRAAEELLLGAHGAAGLPWWGSIVLTTAALRGAVTLPLAAYQHYVLAKVRARPLPGGRLGRACPSFPRGVCSQSTGALSSPFRARWVGGGESAGRPPLAALEGAAARALRFRGAAW